MAKRNVTKEPSTATDFIPDTEPGNFDDYGGDAAPSSALTASGPATLSAQAKDAKAEPTAFDPGGDIQTHFQTQVVGREIVITRWALAPVAEQYANANSYGLFAILGFYFANDTEKKPRFTTNGSQRIVEAIYASILAGEALPIKTTVTSFTTRGGFTGYRFLRPGEAVR